MNGIAQTTREKRTETNIIFELKEFLLTRIIVNIALKWYHYNIFIWHQRSYWSGYTSKGQKEAIVAS